MKGTHLPEADDSFALVEDWLRSLGLLCYAQQFYDNGYEDLEIIKKIGDSDLNAIGIKNEKDRNDIIAGVHRLKQRPVYFELEPEQEELFDVPQKFDPLLLKTLVKESLEKDDTKLTEPPYFYPDGSLGSLHTLAENISYELKTFQDDVLEALEQLRRRQLPASCYDDMAAKAQNGSVVNIDHDKSVKSKSAPRKPSRSTCSEPPAYLNIETPSGFRRTVSLSKHDKRITKSTTNLADSSLDEEVSSPTSTCFTKDKRPVTVKKKSKPIHKTNSVRKLFQSVKRKSPVAQTTKGSHLSSIIDVKDATISQDQIKDLMTKVKHHEISQDQAIAEAEKRGVRVSRSFDSVSLSPSSSPEQRKKGKDKKKDKKGKTKVKKSGSKSPKNSGKNAYKKTGSSVFYTPADDGESETDVHNMGFVPENETDLIHLHGSSGSDLSRESPDLGTFNLGKNVKSPAASFKPINDRHSPYPGDQATRSRTSLNSSCGSISSSTSSVASAEFQDIGKERQNTLKKVPPPVPVRQDIQPTETSPTFKSKPMQPPVGFMNQLKQAQSLKHGPFPPPRNVPSGEVKSEHSLPRKDTDIVDIQNKLLNQNSVQPNQGVNTAMDKRASLKIKGFPFKSDASEGKGYKQDAVESSAPSSFVTVMPNSSSGPQSSINSEPVAPAPPPRRDRAGTGPEDPNIPSPVAFTEKSPSAPSKVPNGSIRHTTSSNPPNLKMAPRPPERRDYKMNTTDTDKRIFGKSVGPELEKRFSGISVTSQRSSSRPSSTEGQNVPAPPPRASDIPSTLSMNRSDFPVQNTNVNTNVPVAPPRAKRNVKRTVSSTSSESSSTEVDPRVDNSRRLSTSSSESDRVNSLNRVVNHDSYPEGGKTPPLARKPLLKPKPKPTLPPRPPEQKPEIAKTKPIVKPDLGQPLKVNELSNAVNLQQSLHKSINQTEVSPQTAKDNKQGDDSVFLSSNSDTTTHSVKTPEARNRLIKAKPLKELIQKKLRKERIDITEPPYTDESGCWNVPYPLVQRYSEELGRSTEEIIENLDIVRKELNSEVGKQVELCNIAYVVENSVREPNTSSLRSWLISIGLPMFAEDFKDTGINAVSQLKDVSEEDVKGVGVFEQTHITRLFEEFEKVRKEL